MIDFAGLLSSLVRHDVEFIIVGGVAGVLQGAPLVTRDVDILYSLRDENPDRLLAALVELDAEFRGDPRRIRPNRSHLASRGHKLLTTSLGALDCLGTIDEDSTYEDLIGDSEWMTLGADEVRVLTLPKLIEIKSKLDRTKDRLAVLQLAATLDERRRAAEALVESEDT